LPTSSDAAIEVRGLAKRYRLGQNAFVHGSLREAIAGATASVLHRARRRQPAEREWLWALDHIDLDVHAGEVLGIIGRNGAGKTTLLKLLSRITEPTEGEARIRGRVGSLLEVGTGFHGDLTGRENIYLNGAILGMGRKEIGRKFDEIVAFAEVERFIDTPVKRYSSGMYLRLAFAVAAHLEPEILIVDEVLAVGDAAFQRKCLGKMGEVSGEGRTVLLVSHNMSAITSLATRCLWLDKGTARELGEPGDVVAAYLSDGHDVREPGVADLRGPEPRRTSKPTQREILVDAIRLRGADDAPRSVFFEGERMRFELALTSTIEARALEMLVKVLTLEGTLVFTLTSGTMDVDVQPGPFEVEVEVPSLPLRRGNYQVDLYLRTSLAQDDVHGAIEFEVAGARERHADPRAHDYLGLVNVEHEWGEIRQAQPETARVQLRR
jgi:lipopolysaccharide transport system ATP-binding protein